MDGSSVIVQTNTISADPKPTKEPNESCLDVAQVAINVSKRRHQTVRVGENSIVTRVKLPINKRLDYSALVVFSRKECGIDFLEKLDDGTITVDLMDAVGSEGLYTLIGKHYHVDESESGFVMQFNKAGKCEKCMGNQEKDMYDMIMTGFMNVDWGKKNKSDCFKYIRHGFTGVRGTPKVQGQKEKNKAWEPYLSNEDITLNVACQINYKYGIEKKGQQ